MNIGEKISSIRKQKGIKQIDLAKTIGLSKNGLQKIEYGDVQPKTSTIRKIAKALDVSTLDLDDSLKEMVTKWDAEHDIQKIASEAATFDAVASTFGDDVVETLNNYLSLNDDGKQKASEYIELLMQKYKK